MNRDIERGRHESTTAVIEREAQAGTDPVDPTLTEVEQGATVTDSGDLVSGSAKDGLAQVVRDTDGVVNDNAVTGGRHPTMPGPFAVTSARGDAVLAGALATANPIMPLGSQPLTTPAGGATGHGQVRRSPAAKAMPARVNWTAAIIGLLLVATIVVAFSYGRFYQNGIDQTVIGQYAPSAAGG
jgi:hypothetical protein